MRKKWKDKLPVALIFPNRYRLGMSNLGFQLVYSLLNQDQDIVCERVFLPESGEGQPLSVESGRPLRDFPLLFCSLSFEDDYPALLQMLVAGGISPLAEERQAQEGQRIRPGSPLLIGGGVATFINPEPLAPFFDLLVLGEAEAVLAPLVDGIKKAIVVDEERESLLYRLAAQCPGCYAPRFYTPLHDQEGAFTSFAVAPGLPPRIRKITLDQQTTAGHSQLLSPDAEFSDLYLTELGRGCSRGCRFCAAGFVYRPPRLWSAEAIINALAQRPAMTSRIGLLGMEMARADELAALAEYLLKESCSLSFSSLRADVIGERLLELLRESGLKSAAIAPDGGSERLRRV
ncbi:MAG: radical SAM protein, partial [Desulfobulbaceae bacterium]|nr:radical SAM protein [Desulfobulbaceae bacterium]